MLSALAIIFITTLFHPGWKEIVSFWSDSHDLGYNE
jgi:hypothetical protein